MVNIASGEPGPDHQFPGTNSGPSFSPDGNRIALTLSKDGNPEIYIYPSTAESRAGSRARRDGIVADVFARGHRMVYSLDDRGTPQLFQISREVSATDRRDRDSDCTKPDWSPDGKWIAFTARIDGSFQIGVFDLAKRTAELITTSGGQDPAWTRDSRHLVYSNNGHLYLLDTGVAAIGADRHGRNGLLGTNRHAISFRTYLPIKLHICIMNRLIPQPPTYFHE